MTSVAQSLTTQTLTFRKKIRGTNPPQKKNITLIAIRKGAWSVNFCMDGKERKIAYELQTVPGEGYFVSLSTHPYLHS